MSASISSISSTSGTFSWSLVMQTVCGLRFFYNVTLGQPHMLAYIPNSKRPQTLPTILSQADVAALLQAPRRLKTRAILMTLYAAWLRVSELCHLQVTDIDSARMVLCVWQGEGWRDRCVMLSTRLLALLRQYWQREKPRPWLFPGRDRTQPMARKTVYLLCREAGVKAQLSKAVLSASVAPCVCQSLIGGWRGFAAPATPVGASKFAHDQPLSPCDAPCADRDSQSARPLTRPYTAGGPAMTRPALEVADIVRQYGDAYLARWRRDLDGAAPCPPSDCRMPDSPR